ncbi:MAG TPA: hypothetical protein VK892_05420 [Pyrinomonadaceae bacterium]|nr:hypothetical protein [Pyrinomonadaceae bacterium]
MSGTVSEFVEKVRHFSSAQQREVLARLWTEQAGRNANETWKTIKLGEILRLAAYDSSQEPYLEDLREALMNGVLARLENEAEGTYEIYGVSRTFYVTMTIEREFVGLLSSWSPENPPREIEIEGER